MCVYPLSRNATGRVRQSFHPSPTRVAVWAAGIGELEPLAVFLCRTAPQRYARQQSVQLSFPHKCSRDSYNIDCRDRFLLANTNQSNCDDQNDNRNNFPMLNLLFLLFMCTMKFYYRSTSQYYKVTCQI